MTFLGMDGESLRHLPADGCSISLYWKRYAPSRGSKLARQCSQLAPSRFSARSLIFVLKYRAPQLGHSKFHITCGSLAMSAFQARGPRQVKSLGEPAGAFCGLRATIGSNVRSEWAGLLRPAYDVRTI